MAMRNMILPSLAADGIFLSHTGENFGYILPKCLSAGLPLFYRKETIFIDLSKKIHVGVV